MSISYVKCSFIKATEGVGGNIRTASSFQGCFPELLGEAPTVAPRFCSLPTDLRWIQTFRPTGRILIALTPPCPQCARPITSTHTGTHTEHTQNAHGGCRSLFCS